MAVSYAVTVGATVRADPVQLLPLRLQIEPTMRDDDLTGTAGQDAADSDGSGCPHWKLVKLPDAQQQRPQQLQLLMSCSACCCCCHQGQLERHRSRVARSDWRD